MARKLQDRLALANYKAQHDLANMSFALVEATMMNRKRDASSIAASSDTSSTSSDHRFFSQTFASSPITAPFFSADAYGSQVAKNNRQQTLYEPLHSDTHAGARKRLRTQSMAPPLTDSSRSTWRAAHNLSGSSPIHRRQSSKFSTSHGPNLSFVSESPTIPHSPPFGSQDDTQDLPRHSFSMNTSKFHASPPRTPPPTRSSGSRKRKGNAKAEEGADLLLYLATSPSPAKPGAKPRIFAPSTPPPNAQALPSSMMSTPGASAFMAGFDTPGQQFNFADFVNITPSPAQGAFGNRTPGPARTPLAAREARRKLNFDSLLPPSGSPKPGHGGKETGLGMELGGELVS
ncbi:MAG: hypothetical protein HETSPECPRED_003571 [Heterodermia speciosa]|uniref:Uncharacterized protein n=1 Tax=Heterodermia speciosa TaxID=116794 RepID=A0A8H3F806_9LECA|nr:MAG: hypothetical protein HETSPECPRED_003571 [Heterodermia speciosa]